MTCIQRQPGKRTTVSVAVKKPPNDDSKPYYKLCVYRLSDNPDKIYVKAVGVSAIHLVSGYGVIESP